MLGAIKPEKRSERSADKVE